MRVLQIAVGINGGGVGAVLLNYYSHMDHNDVKFDIVIDDLPSVKNGSLNEATFKQMGCNIFRVTPKSVNLRENIRQVSEIMKNGNYDVLHSNMEEWSALYCCIAKKHGINTRIAHAHLAYVNTPSLIKKMYNRVLKTGLKHYATDFFACSRDAGKYLFGDSILKKDNFKVLPNAIETDKYIYNCETRNRIRKEFGISNNTFVVGFVGRLYYQKNPERMIRIFNEICKKHTDSQLVIVGDYKSYSKFSELTDYAKKNGIYNQIIYTGLRQDVPDVMQAFDAFVLPSRYEGFGIVYIEAQTAGLMTFGTAKVVPEEVNCTKLMNFIDSKKTDKEWAEIILNKSLNYTRENLSTEIRNSGFEIAVEAKKLQRFYIEKASKY